MLVDDINLIRTSLFNDSQQISLYVYDIAIIYGTCFKSRGMDYREIKEAMEYREKYGQQTTEKIPHKACNRVCTIRTLQTSCSSWFSFKSNSLQNVRTLKSQSNQVGQFNGFFRVHFDQEALLHGIPVGSMTGRKCEKHPYSFFKVSCNVQNYLSTSFFVPLTDVYSTQLGIIALDKSGRVMDKDNYSLAETQVEAILIIELHQQRKCIVYERDEISKYNNMDVDVDSND